MHATASCLDPLERASDGNALADLIGMARLCRSRTAGQPPLCRRVRGGGRTASASSKERPSARPDSGRHRRGTPRSGGLAVGSGAGGDTDALSDLDLSVVACDDALSAVAGDPSRPLDHRHVLASPRGTWVAQVIEPPLLLLESPQNAPLVEPLTSFFAGEAGPQRSTGSVPPVDCAPSSRVVAAVRPCRIPPEAGPTSPGTWPGPGPYAVRGRGACHSLVLGDAAREREAWRRVSPRQPHVDAGANVRAVYDSTVSDPESVPPAGEPTIDTQSPDTHPRDLCDRMGPLMPRAAALSAEIPPGLVHEARESFGSLTNHASTHRPRAPLPSSDSCPHRGSAQGGKARRVDRQAWPCALSRFRYAACGGRPTGVERGTALPE